MKYDEDFKLNQSQSSASSSSNSQSIEKNRGYFYESTTPATIVKAPVGIIKKTSSYQNFSTPQQAINNNNLVNNSRFSKVANSDQTEKSNFQDLLVIGYSSNLYRDDFMAMKLESRDILIPWNGDQNLLIDR